MFIYKEIVKTELYQREKNENKKQLNDDDDLIFNDASTHSVICV